MTERQNGTKRTANHPFAAFSKNCKKSFFERRTFPKEGEVIGKRLIIYFLTLNERINIC